MEKTEYSAGAIVYTTINNEYHFLVIQQKNTSHFGFPKGHIEENESFQQTAEREVLEETGIKIKIFPTKFEVSKYTMGNDIKKEVTIFLAEAINTNINFQLEEVLSASWLTKNEVLDILTYENDLTIFKRLTLDL